MVCKGFSSTYCCYGGRDELDGGDGVGGDGAGAETDEERIDSRVLN